MAYLQMYIMITVCIFHKTEQEESLHSWKRNRKTSDFFAFNVTIWHSYTHEQPFLHIHIHSLTQCCKHGFVSRLRKTSQISDQRNSSKWLQIRGSVLACFGELRRANLENPMRVICIGLYFVSLCDRNKLQNNKQKKLLWFAASGSFSHRLRSRWARWKKIT